MGALRLHACYHVSFPLSFGTYIIAPIVANPIATTARSAPGIVITDPLPGDVDAVLFDFVVHRFGHLEISGFIVELEWLRLILGTLECETFDELVYFLGWFGCCDFLSAQLCASPVCSRQLSGTLETLAILADIGKAQFALVVYRPISFRHFVTPLPSCRAFSVDLVSFKIPIVRPDVVLLAAGAGFPLLVVVDPMWTPRASSP